LIYIIIILKFDRKSYLALILYEKLKDKYIKNLSNCFLYILLCMNRSIYNYQPYYSPSPSAVSIPTYS